ncbi:hypothetical protein FIBSPDRAFT_877363 [Athelia psychrophila]|uniref:Uncharacterized protein n=1 Tax=Athelia psychrophila TaxID=1759441 RepID=A0A167W2D7_9AGAM|nr:hypothetical protein FIBSPDRAFT_877363 [Fibularhizoctonia sp. CBS 109695]
MSTIVPCQITHFHTIVGTVTPSIVDTYTRLSIHPSELALCLAVYEKVFKLEQSAALVLAALDTAQTRGRGRVRWSRAEVNILRKFLFIVGQRATAAWRRYAHYGSGGDLDAHGAQGREIEAFRVAHGLLNARCAWLFSLQNLLDTPHWAIPTCEKILQRDRATYEEDMRYRQLAIYEAPSEPGCDFPLTQGSLGMATGQATLFEDDGGVLGLPRATGGRKMESSRGCAVTLVKIYPVSPRLIIFLTHVEMPPCSSKALSREVSALSKFPSASTQVTYDPPLSPSAISFSRKPPGDWTPEEIQRESDFRHDHILDGKSVYARLSDCMDVEISELSRELFVEANEMIRGSCDESDKGAWMITPTVDAMKDRIIAMLSGVADWGMQDAWGLEPLSSSDSVESVWSCCTEEES